MKKIIYSLVIMIAAGSLFTSCIEQVEPLGIQDMRFAKAEYIRALKDLRAADAEYVRAQAAFELARARYKDAQTANLNADTEYQQLLNEYQQLINEARQDTNDFIAQEIANRIDSVKKRMELREKEHAAKMVAAEDSLAMAQERLRITLRNIALYSQSLTPDEQYALMDAVDMYEAAVEATADQTIVVLQAQRTLDSLKMVREVGPDTVYDKDSKAYVGAIEKWKGDIEEKEIEQALVLALLLAVPDSLDYEDVNGWQEQIEKLVADSAAIEYAKYENKIEMANYYTTYIHDNVAYFDTVTAQWMRANEKPAVVTEPNKSDSKYYTQNAKVIDIPVFADLKVASSAAYAKFAYLLNSYKENSPVDSWKTEKEVIYVSGDTMYVTADQSMKGFVMGAADATKDSLTYQTKTKDGKKDSVLLKAMYGIDGAVSVLERDKVLDKTAGSKDTAELRKARDTKKEAWEKDREILIKGLTSYQPYIDALTAYNAAVEEATKEEANMVSAVTALKSAFTSCNSGAVSRNDSVRILDAFKAFAAAREKYLGYEYSGKGHDSTYFVYSKGKGTSAILDSVKFVDLDFKALADSVYNWDAAGEGDVKYPYSNPTKFVSAGTVGLANIANQLLGETVANLLADPASVAGSGWDVIGTTGEVINDNTEYVAFYRTYKYVVGTPDKIVDKTTDEEVESKVVADAKAAVLAAVASYVEVYNQFWGVAVCNVEKDAKTKAPIKSDFDGRYNTYFAATTDKAKADALKDAEKAVKDTNALSYKAAAYSFDTFNTPTNVVSFVNTDAKKMVDWSNAIGAILGSVEYAITEGAYTDGKEFKDGDNMFVTDTKTFGTATARTEFYTYMKAEWEYQVALQDFDADLAKIKAWVEKVKKAFADDEAQAGQFKESDYNRDVNAYNTYKTKKATYDAALKEFTGSENQNPIMIGATVSTPANFTNVNEVLLTAKVGTTPVAGGLVKDKDSFDTYPGEWNAKLGGKQLEMAKELFPDYPELIAEWYEEQQEAKDELDHIKVLIPAAKKAYFAAAQAADENVKDAANWDQLIANYEAANKAYRERLLGIIEKLQGEIETIEERIAKFNQGIPQLDIAIAEAEKELKVETARLQGYEEALAYAKANLDKLMEYIKSLDANFVVPAFDPTKII